MSKELELPNRSQLFVDDDAEATQYRAPSRWRRGVLIALWAGLLVATGAGILLVFREESAELLAARELMWKLCGESDLETRRRLAQTAESSLRSLQGHEKPSDEIRVLMAALLDERGEGELRQHLAKVSLSSCSPVSSAVAAAVLSDNHQFEVAERLLMSAKRFAPRSPTTLHAAVKFHYEQNQLEAALASCQEWTRSAPTSAEPFRWILRIQEERGLIHVAADACVEILRRTTADQAMLTQKRVRLLLQMGDAMEARRVLSEASANATDQSVDRGWKLLDAELTELEGDVARAAQLVDDVLLEAADDPTALVLKSRLLLALDADREQARRLLQRASELRPQDFNIHFLLSQVYARDQRRDLAQHHADLHARLKSNGRVIEKLEHLARRRPLNDAASRWLSEQHSKLGRDEQIPTLPSKRDQN